MGLNPPAALDAALTARVEALVAAEGDPFEDAVDVMQAVPVALAA